MLQIQPAAQHNTRLHVKTAPISHAQQHCHFPTRPSSIFFKSHYSMTSSRYIKGVPVYGVDKHEGQTQTEKNYNVSTQ